VQFSLTAGRPLVIEVGYIPVPERVYKSARKRVRDRTMGAVFGGDGSQVVATLESLLAAGKCSGGLVRVLVLKGTRRVTAASQPRGREPHGITVVPCLG
jgi:hypothetical protein